MFRLKLEMLCTHSNVNPMDKSKMKAKSRVLILWQSYFCLKSTFSPENQTCTEEALLEAPTLFDYFVALFSSSIFI